MARGEPDQYHLGVIAVPFARPGLLPWISGALVLLLIPAVGAAQDAAVAPTPATSAVSEDDQADETTTPAPEADPVVEDEAGASARAVSVACRPTAAACLAGCPGGWFRSKGGICVPAEVPPARRQPGPPRWTAPIPSSGAGGNPISHDESLQEISASEDSPNDDFHVALLFNPVGAVAASLLIDEVGVALPFNLQMMVGDHVGLDFQATALVAGEVNGGAGGGGLRFSLGDEAFQGLYLVPRLVFSSMGGLGFSAEVGWSIHRSVFVCNLGGGFLYSAGDDEYEGGFGPLLNLSLGVGR